MPTNFAFQHTPTHSHADRADPWAELRRYEQAKADGTAPEASFGDLLDVINPLQHIPVVSTIYREITGDTIQGAARIVGGGLYGGVGGFVGGLVNAIAEEATGRDLGDHVMVAMGLSEDTHADDTAPSVHLAEVEAADGERAEGKTTDAAASTGTATPMTAKAADTVSAQTHQGEAAQPQVAGEDAALAGGGALTGLAALTAFARDIGQAAAAAQADRTVATRATAELQGAQQASAATDRTPPSATPSAPSPAAPASTATTGASGAPSQFMALGDRGALINHRVRTNPALLAAESDSIDHRRLQGDPRSVPIPQTASPRAPTPPASQAPGAPAAAPGTATRQPNAAASAAHGDLAERMMRALNKYEAMHRAD